ncbi:MAG: DUF2461 domain-containing protein [Mesotoga infera]
MDKFNGFTRATLDFLVDLGKNNNRAWMEANRERYREVLLDPFKALVTELGPFMEELDPFLETRPQVGKTISRISRDARRNRGKAPYRTNMWLTFKVPSPDWKDSPGFFFELFPDSYRYGMGFYFPSRETMRKLIFELEENTRTFLEKTAILREGHFLIMGEKYKRPRKKEGVPDELLVWYQMKDFYISVERGMDETLFSGEFADLLRSEFKALTPLYEYFWEIRMKKEE